MRKFRTCRHIEACAVIASTAVIASAAVVAAPAAARACEPILPLAVAMGGTLFALKSLTWLAVVVAVKCGVFIFFCRRINPFAAAASMALGNVLSTVVGGVLAVTAANPAGFMFSLPVLFIFSLPPSLRLSEQSSRVKSGIFAAMAVVFMLFVTWILFGLSQGLLMGEGPLAAYWVVKVVFATCAVGISIVLTVLWEEWVIAKAVKHPEGGNYYVPVFRANAVAFILIMGVAAIETLPARLASPDFLVLLRDFLRSAV